MRVSSWIDDLPIEAWAAAVGRAGRRTKRRVRRKPLQTALFGLGLAAAGFISTNALFDQSERHPAPIFSASAPTATPPTLREAPLVASHSQAQAAEADDLVRKIQTGLRAKGLFGGEATGILDDETRAAISALEAERGLPTTGEPSLGLLAAVAAPSPSAPVVRQVSLSGDNVVLSVREVQAALNTLGYGPLTVDGVLGPRSRSALDRYAESRGLIERGMVPTVLRALAEDKG